MSGNHPPNQKRARPKQSPTKKASVTSTKTQTKPDKPRTKSPGTLLENQFSKGKTFCNIVCRLGSICKDRALINEIHRSVHALKQIQLEAWHLVNLHTLRCLDNGLSLPDYCSPTFFDHICSGVATTPKTHLIARKNPDLWNSIKIYQTQREEAGLRGISNLTGYSTLKAQLRQQMMVNAGVMIREHFYKRLHLYVNIAFGGVTTRDMTKQQKKERNERLRSIMKACFSTDTTDDPGAHKMRSMLTPEGCAWGEKFFPYSNRIKENGLEFYVRLLYKFQQKVNERMKEVPNEKGVRAFSLFPVSTSYVGGHITINASTLSGFYSRIKRVEEYEWTGVSLSAASFQHNRWAVMRNAFSIESFETRHPDCPLTKPEFALMPVEEKYRHASHLFANQVTTDGYSASVLLFRLKTEEELIMESQKHSKEKSERPVISPGYVPDVVIGLDPGMRAVCTAVRESIGASQHARRVRRRRSRRIHQQKKKKGGRPQWIRRRKLPRQKNNRDIVSVSAREYRHMAGFNRFQAWNEGQRRLHPRYKEALRGMPSFKTSGYSQYLENLQYFWRHAKFLLDFCVERPYLKWKFFRKRMARVAVDAIAKRIVPTVSLTTCVAFGDWCGRSGIKGHAPSPIKGLKDALKKRATVVSMDEFRTSKLCSQCHQMLSSVRYSVDTRLPRRKKRKGVVLVRNRAEVEFEQKKCYAVLRCDHKECEAQYWDRDVNAAINMLELLKSEVLGLGRMDPFRR